MRKHRARGELEALAEDFDADVMCLQECQTEDLPGQLDTLHLADTTKTNRLGLAVYVNQERFTIKESRAFSLKKSLHDRILSPAHERLIGTTVTDNGTGHDLVIGSFHAAPLTASNSLRRHQIHHAHAELLKLGDGSAATLMVGDFNYPLFTRNLNSHMEQSGYDLSLSDQRTYTRYLVFRGHFDFATSQGFNVESVETLPRGDSDHRPILITAEYLQANDRSLL